MSNLPAVLQRVLDADESFRASNRLIHPRIHNRLWDKLREARAALEAEYPCLEEWLFGFQVRDSDTERRIAELQRLVAWVRRA